MRLFSEEPPTNTLLANPSNAYSGETRSSTSGLKRIIQVRLQPLMGLNPQTQLPRTQQGQRQRQHDPTYPQLEKLSCSVVNTDDLHSPLILKSLAHYDH